MLTPVKVVRYAVRRFSTDVDVEVLPCPICRQLPEIRWNGSSPLSNATVFCPNKCGGQTNYTNDKELAVIRAKRSWNKAVARHKARAE